MAQPCGLQAILRDVHVINLAIPADLPPSIAVLHWALHEPDAGTSDHTEVCSGGNW